MASLHDCSVLASESRLRFNADLGLLTAARGWNIPNGAPLNGISGYSIISYGSFKLCQGVRWLHRVTCSLFGRCTSSAGC
ncbi:hypothetical protein BDR03DRAFT_940079, partial [Suillus americanus]